MHKKRSRNDRGLWAAAGAAVLLALAFAETPWAQLPDTLPGLPDLWGTGTAATPGTGHPLFELAKLVAAALIGLVVTAVHGHSRPEKAVSRPLAHAQILFCVAGALVIIIIGNSLPRAFGAFGVASIIRFRTPLKNPKEAAILFLLIGLGMACGGGLFAVAGLGTLFFCLFLLALDRVGRDEEKPRYMALELVAAGGEFPSAHVQNVLAHSRAVFEPREISHGKETVVRYHVALDPKTSLDELNTKLLEGGTAGIKSVAWEPAKKSG